MGSFQGTSSSHYTSPMFKFESIPGISDIYNSFIKRELICCQGSADLRLLIQISFHNSVQVPAYLCLLSTNVGMNVLKTTYVCKLVGV